MFSKKICAFATYSEEILGEVLSQDVQDAFVEMYDSLEY